MEVIDEMKVFISWSGQRSQAVAELLHEWLKCVIQATKPWISSRDIDRGTLWFSEINEQLKDTSIGIIVITQDNKSKPWILFEAGALAKGLSTSRVCTFLTDLQPEELENPLAQFNHTFPSKKSMQTLVTTINSTLKDNALDEKVLETVFDTYWEQFRQKFDEIKRKFPIEETVVKRSEDEILLEILRTTRGLERRIRSVENTREHSSISRMPGHIAERLITEMVKDGIDTDFIIKKLMSEGVPRGFIQSVINDYFNEEIESDDDSAV